MQNLINIHFFLGGGGAGDQGFGGSSLNPILT